MALMVQTPALEVALNGPSAESWGPFTHTQPIITVSQSRRELANYSYLLMRRAERQTIFLGLARRKQILTDAKRIGG